MELRSPRLDAPALLAVAGTVTAFEMYLQDPSEYHHTRFQEAIERLEARLYQHPEDTKKVLDEYMTFRKANLNNNVL